MTIRKGAFLLLLLWGIPVLAQEKTEYDRIQKRTSIIQGAASIGRDELFDDNLVFDFDLHAIYMLSNPVGLGLKTTGLITRFDGDFESGIAIGPVIRANLYQQNTFFVYTEVFHQIAHDLRPELLVREIETSNVNNRSGLALGISARLGNRAGVFFRFQHLWERNERTHFLSSNMRVRSLSAGIELFSF